MKINNFYDAFHFLEGHPIFKGEFLTQLYMEVVLVDPATNAVDDDFSRNTTPRIWMETGPNEKDEYGWGCHDLDLDSAGATYEEAIIDLAGKVLAKYGSYHYRRPL